MVDKVQTIKLFFKSCLLVACELCCSSVYAEEGKYSLFLEGRKSNYESTLNCSSSCSGDPGATLGIGIAKNIMDTSSNIIFNTMASIDYSRYRYGLNGNLFDVTEKGLHVHLEWSLNSYPEYILALRGGLGWITSSGASFPERTLFTGGSGIDFIYKISHDLGFIIGTYTDPISPTSQVDLYWKTIDVGLRWYL